MTAKAALAKALLDGHVITVMNCFRLIGLTNAAREIPRMIEQPFDVQVARTTKTGTTRYGQPCRWTQYRLNKTVYNETGIKLMWDYVNEQRGAETAAPTPFTQEKLF